MSWSEDDNLDAPRYFDSETGVRLDHRERCPKPLCMAWTMPRSMRKIANGWTRCRFECCGIIWTNDHEPLPLGKEVPTTKTPHERRVEDLMRRLI
jgi:hypothetical protein